MADELLQPNADQQILEQDLLRLVKEVETHKQQPENAGLDDQAIVKMAVRSLAAQAAVAPTPAPVSNPPPPGSLPAYAQNAPAATKLEIEYLLDVAMRNGLDKANEEARKTSPFVLDAFHDALTGKLYDELQKRGMLK